MRNMKTFILFLWILIAGIALFVKPVRDLWWQDRELYVPIMNVLFLTLFGVFAFVTGSSSRFRR